MRKACSYYKEDDTFNIIQKARKENYNRLSVNYLDDNIQKELNNSIISKAILNELVNDIKCTINIEDDDIFNKDTKKDEKKNNNPKLVINNINEGKSGSIISNSSSYSKDSYISQKNEFSHRKIKNNYSFRSNKNITKNNNKLSIDNKYYLKRYLSNNNLLEVKNNKTEISDNISNKDKKSEMSSKRINEISNEISNDISIELSDINNDISNNIKNKIEQNLNIYNPNTIHKKSSLKNVEVKKINLYKNDTLKNSLFKSPSFNLQNKKTVKFEGVPKTNTVKKNNNNIIFNPIRKLSDGNNFISNFRINENFDDDNEELYKKTQLTNRNILEINEIKYDLKKSIVLTRREKFKLSELNTKTFLYDHDESFESEELNEDETKELIKQEKINLDKEKNYRELQRKGLVYDSLDEYNDDIDISTFFIHPDSKYLITLDFLVVICVFYNLIYIPFFLGYNEIYCNSGNFFSITSLIDLFIDIIYLIDFIIHFFVAYYNEDDILKTELHLIIINNLRTWFIIDLMCVIPFKTLFTIYDTQCEDIHFLSSYKNQNHLYYLLVCLRLMKTFKLYQNAFFEYCDEILDKHVHYNNYFNFYLGGTIFFTTIHLVTCILIFIGKNEYPSWIIKFGFSDCSFGELYFIGIYYIITTVTTVGYGDLTCVTPKEKVFGIIVEIVGIVAYSYVLTSISNYVRSKKDAEEEYFKKYKILQEIKITYKDLSDDLFDRINRYIKNKQNNEEQEKNLIEELPISLKNTLVYCMYQNIIENFIFFKNFDNRDFIVRVILCFNPILAVKNDILIKDGDFVEDIILVKKGKISIELPVRINPENDYRNSLRNTKSRKSFYFPRTKKTKTSKLSTKSSKINSFLNNYMSTLNYDDEREEIIEYQNLKLLDIRRNEHFGDVLMLSNERSPLTAIVKSRKAELFYLNKKDSIEISNEYPQIWSKIQKKSVFNMKQIKRLMDKVMRIFYKTKGIKGKNMDKTNITNLSYNSFDDKSINSENNIFQQNDDLYSDNNIKNNKYSNVGNGKQIINNLKTIKEVTYIEDSDVTNSVSHISNKIKNSKIKEENNESNNSNNQLDSVFDSDSSNYNYKKSFKDDGTIKMDHVSNDNIDFSEIYTDRDISKNFIDGRNNLTPFKPNEINSEIYENEIFKYTPDDNKDQEISKKHNQNLPKIMINNNNISICSTEISFSISSKYENIDELSDYKYSKSPILRRKIKTLLKDFDSENFEFSKFKTNKPINKVNSSFNTFHKKGFVTKNSTFKTKKYSKDTSSDRLITINSIKNNPNFNFLDLINENMEKNGHYKYITGNELPTFSDLFHNVLDKKLENFKEFELDKETLNKKFRRLKTTKSTKSQNKTIKSQSIGNDSI